MTHTRGPWKYSKSRCSIVSTTEMQDWTVNSEFVDPSPVEVVSLRGAMGGNDTEADAQLIAAAPELLEALQTIQAQLKVAWSRAHYEEIRVAMHTARAAIAKVTGS